VVSPATTDYGSAHTTDAPYSTDEHLSKNEKDSKEPSSPRKTVTIVEPTDPKTSTGASKETEPLLSS
jgi:hypothetical protein